MFISFGRRKKERKMLWVFQQNDFKTIFLHIIASTVTWHWCCHFNFLCFLTFAKCYPLFFFFFVLFRLTKRKIKRENYIDSSWKWLNSTQTNQRVRAFHIFNDIMSLLLDIIRSAYFYLSIAIKTINLNNIKLHCSLVSTKIDLMSVKLLVLNDLRLFYLRFNVLNIAQM